MKSNCVCIIFVFVDDNLETITVRGCALDSGTLTTDTEIIRMSHCGKFYYDERWNYIIEDKFPFQFNKNLSILFHRYVHGCLQSCSDSDGCNGASINLISIAVLIICYLTSIAFFRRS